MSNAVFKGHASGTGTVTLETPNTNSDRTISLPDATGTVMVSGNMPAFSAYADTAQTISSGTLTKVTFGTEEFDTNNNFASSRFTPTVAGYYQFNATILCKASSTLTFAGLSFYKNGSNAIRTLNVPIASFSEPSISASCLLYLNGSTDYVEVYGSITGTGTITFGFNDSAITSRFTGSMVRGA